MVRRTRGDTLGRASVPARFGGVWDGGAETNSLQSGFPGRPLFAPIRVYIDLGNGLSNQAGDTKTDTPTGLAPLAGAICETMADFASQARAVGPVFATYTSIYERAARMRRDGGKGRGTSFSERDEGRVLKQDLYTLQR
jgi:hypothetical protein